MLLYIDVYLCIWRAGTKAELLAEAGRLGARLEMLRAGEAAAQATKPHEAADKDGRMLSLLLEWRQQRIAAIKAEIDRLNALAEQ